jgi:hypothetical protein
MKTIRERGAKKGDRVKTKLGYAEILWFQPGGLTPTHACVVLEGTGKRALVTIDSCIRARKRTVKAPR